MKLSLQMIIWSLVLIGIAIAASLAFMPQTVNVETVTVVHDTLRVFVREDGKTRIREKYIVSAPVAGRISRIELKPGDNVNNDDSLIAVILPADPTMLDARARAQAETRVEQADAALQRAKVHAEQVRANYNLDKAKFERAQKLVESHSISQNEYDIARTTYLVSSQSVRTSKFDTEIAEYELKMAKAALLQFSRPDESYGELFELHSPIEGKVLRVFQESATVVGVGAPLLEVGDPQNLEIEIDVLSTDAVRIPPFAELTVDHWGGESPLKGRVRVVEPSAFTKISSLGVEEQRVNIIADFDEPADRLKRLGDGYRVEARITIQEIENADLIPNSALFRHQSEWHVFAVENDVARMVSVEIGAQNETHTQVISGLQEGAEVIVYPSDEIASGTKIQRINRD